MATKKKDEMSKAIADGLKSYGRRRLLPEYRYAFPDDRNRLIEEARELLSSYLYCKNKGEADYKLMDKHARRWLRETKP